ncbi:helix-turn-helix domain-containing protein [Bremerella cremea]|uniref:helix-turn-helix domain-containing protein n=1 Tax=Bremerella cremea TaxID=1031537 RepID=UPI001313ED43|nr:helix-turn-helix transcriptional regulator [Bremerella cremea]
MNAARVSERSQASHLASQLLGNHQKLEWLFYENIIDTPGEIARGYIFDSDYRKALNEIVKLAEELNAIIVYQDLDRAIRSNRYPDDNYAMPTAAEFEEWIKLFRGVPVTTILPFDTPRMGKGGIRGMESARGMRANGNKPGPKPKAPPKPGYMNDRRKTKIGQALEMREHGLTLRQVSDALGIPRSTISDWENRPDNK